MILAAHQPNYLPWLGYFYKLAHSDVFVILDDVQFTKNSLQNRTRIKTSTGPAWLTQPVLTSGRALQPTNEVAFDTRVDWRTKHLKTLLANYGRTCYARDMLEMCNEFFAHADERLAETNVRIIRRIARSLGCRAEIVLSSSLEVRLSKGARLAEICRRLGATTYLSGQGGRNYQSEDDFRSHGIDLTYTGFLQRAYSQLWGEFCPGLSAIDALFNLGPAGTAALLRSAAPPVAHRTDSGERADTEIVTIEEAE